MEPPACLMVKRAVVFFDALECLSFSLSYLLTARNGSVVLLGPCQVLVVQSFAFSFRLSKVRSLLEWFAEVLLYLTWGSNTSNFEFSQLLLRRSASPEAILSYSTVSFSFHSTSDNEIPVRFAGAPSRKHRWAFFSIFVVQKVRVWAPRLLFFLMT